MTNRVDLGIASRSLDRAGRRVRRWLDWLRFHVGLWLAYRLWSIAEALTAVGNWLEDLAEAQHPLALRTHWKQRGEAVNGWQR